MAGDEDGSDFSVERVILALVAAAVPASALILTGTGNGPVRDPGWPKGASELANLKSRAGWFEGPPFGGGDWTFLYRGGAVELQEAVDALAKIESKERVGGHQRGRAHERDLRDSATNDPLRYDWSFEVSVPCVIGRTCSRNGRASSFPIIRASENPSRRRASTYSSIRMAHRGA